MTINDILSPLKLERPVPKTPLEIVQESQDQFQDNPNEEHRLQLLSANNELINDKLPGTDSYIEPQPVELTELHAIANSWSLLRDPSSPNSDNQPLLSGLYTLLALYEQQHDSSEDVNNFYPAINAVTNGKVENFAKAYQDITLGSHVARRSIRI